MENKKRKVVTLTINPALDIYSTLDKIEPEKKLRCTTPTKDPGGGGVNVSRVLKRLGLDAQTIYTCGGHTGKLFKDLLVKEEITQDVVEIEEDIRQNFAFSEESSGELYRFGFPGASLQEKEIEKVLEKIRKIDDSEFLVISGSLSPGAPVDLYAKIARIAKEKNIKLIVDTSGPPLKKVIEEGAYLIKPNINELEDITGIKNGNEGQLKQLLLNVLNDYPVNAIVMSMGPKGAYLATKGEVHHFPAPHIKAKSSIGAGDSMVAGMVYRLSLGKDLQDAVRFGIACGSATIKSPGTQLLQKKDAEKFFKAMQDSSEKTNDLQEHPGDKGNNDFPPKDKDKKLRDSEVLTSALKKGDWIKAKMEEKDPLFFLDFDGTLAPIVENHEDASISKNMIELVKLLASKYSVAVVSGRGLSDVKNKIGIQDIYYAGSHGFEISGPDGYYRENDEAQDVLPIFDKVEPDLQNKLKDIEGVRFERKKFTLAIHYRKVKEEREKEVHYIVEEVLKNYKSLKKGEGKKVIEIKPALDWHKGRAVETLKKQIFGEGDSLTFYLGDDVTDEDAFESKAIDIGILVGSHGGKTFADYSLESIEEVKTFLKYLVK